MRDQYDPILGGARAPSPQSFEVTDKYTGTVAARVGKADRAMVHAAIARAAEAAPAMRSLAAYQRRDALYHVERRLRERLEEFAHVLCVEVGKPFKDARGEIGRAIDTFRIAAEESTRIYGEHLPLDISERARGYEGLTRRVPIGPCSFITPFNFPVNLAAHKIAPAIAVGCPFVHKPATQTPITAIMLCEILAETSLPPGAFSVVPCDNDDAAPLVEDDRIKHLSFTGSPKVGWMLKAKAGKKTVSLELGGNAACIVDEGTNLETAVPRIIFGAFYQSGQSCISIQRLLVHRSIFEACKSRLIDAASRLKAGNPCDEDTFLGPMITETDAVRVMEWISEAVARGAKVLCGGHRQGAFLDATIVEHVPHDVRLSCQEAFGPVVTIEPFVDFDDACRIVNDSDYGLQAGVFTNNLHHTWRAFDVLEVGGVIINDVPAMRVDSMPYGGVKDSGQGREGVRYAMREMSELRLMVVRHSESPKSK
jgi:acyl-CoA reductase-like NAD-dependent aldehyde dehydrogenase